MILKEVNSCHKYLGCPYLQDNNFEVPRGAITLDKDRAFVCRDSERKPTINYAYFMLNTWKPQFLSW